MISSLIFIFTVLPTLASQARCSGLPYDSTDQLDVSVAIPNCLQQRPLALATNPRRATSALCGCKSEFQQKSMLPPAAPLDLREKQNLFFEAMLSEYEKIQKNNLIEIAKLSAIDQSGALGFPAALAACQFKPSQSFTNGCLSQAAKDFFQKSPRFKSYPQRLADEFLNIMSPLTTTQRQGLMSRKDIFANFNAQQCSLSEADTLRYTSQAIEALISPAFLEAIASKKSELQGKRLEDIFEITKFDPSLEELLRQHPLINLHMTSGDELVALLGSVASPYTKESLTRALIAPTNATLVDGRLAESCATSFTKLRETLCSEDFEKGNIELDPFGNLERLGVHISDYPPVASTPEQVNLNQNVLRFCDWRPSPGSKNLSEAIVDFDQLLDPRYARLSDQRFSEIKFERDIKTPRDRICSMKNESTDCAAYANIVERHSCLAAQMWRASKDDQKDSPLLAGSQRPIHELMKRFLPPTELISQESTQALIQIGLIPIPTIQRPSPAQVAQAAAEVERFNPNFTSIANATLPRSRSQVGAAAVVQADNTRVDNRSNLPVTPQRSAYSAQLAEVMSQKQRMFEESNQTYRGVIDELMKRRMDNPSRQEVTEAVTEEFRRNSKPFDPRSREGQSFINNIVNNYPRAVSQNNPQAITRPFEQERVAQAFEEAVTATNSSPVATAGRSIAGSDVNSIAASARLSSAPSSNGVAKVVVTDPKLNLADPALPQLLQSVLTLNENGEVLQSMLDQRKDFILKLNSTEVMMDFDPEAQNYRIRPLGNVPTEVIASLNRFVNDYSLIARVRGSRHTTLNALVQELQQSQSSL